MGASLSAIHRVWHTIAAFVAPSRHHPHGVMSGAVVAPACQRFGRSRHFERKRPSVLSARIEAGSLRACRMRDDFAAPLRVDAG